MGDTYQRVGSVLRSSDVTPAVYYPTALTVTTGTLAAGVVADVATIGGNVVNVTEVVGSPGFDILFDWTGIVGIPREIHFIGYYDGGANHSPQLNAYDYVGAGFVALETFYDQTAVHCYTFPANGRFVSGGAMQVQLYHAAGGIGTHAMVIDYLDCMAWRM